MTEEPPCRRLVIWEGHIMSPNERRQPEGWKPNDKVIEGRIGADRIKAALEKHGIIIVGGKEVITSRDEGIDDILYELRRTDMPPGIQSWQLPIILAKTPFVFLTVPRPAPIVPPHNPAPNVFRVEISG